MPPYQLVRDLRERPHQDTPQTFTAPPGGRDDLVRLLEQSSQPIKSVGGNEFSKVPGVWPATRQGYKGTPIPARPSRVSGGIYAQNTVEQGANNECSCDERQRDRLRAGHVLASRAMVDCGVHSFCSTRTMASRPKPMTSVMTLGSISSIAAAKKSTRSNHVALRRK